MYPRRHSKSVSQIGWPIPLAGDYQSCPIALDDFAGLAIPLGGACGAASAAAIAEGRSSGVALLLGLPFPSGTPKTSPGRTGGSSGIGTAEIVPKESWGPMAVMSGLLQGDGFELPVGSD